MKKFSPMPDPNSKRSARKKARGIQAYAPHLEKRIHKRSARRVASINKLRSLHMNRRGANQYHFNTPGEQKYSLSA